MQVARDQLAGKEMSVGRYYLNKHLYTAAIGRFREVLAKYQNTRHTEEALERLTEGLSRLGHRRRSPDGGGGAWSQLPGFAMVQGCLRAAAKAAASSPHEDEGSWISKTFKKISFAKTE